MSHASTSRDLLDPALSDASGRVHRSKKTDGMELMGVRAALSVEVRGTQREYGTEVGRKGGENGERGERSRVSRARPRWRPVLSTSHK